MMISIVLKCQKKPCIAMGQVGGFIQIGNIDYFERAKGMVRKTSSF